MTDDDAPDDELLRRARADVAVFATLYERHARSVHAFLGRRAGRTAADDLLGDVFVAALSARARVVPHASGSALPWLYGIAGNVLRAHLRCAEQRTTEARGDAPIVADGSIDWNAIDDRLDASTRRGDLRVALADLTDSERDVLLLVAWEGLTPTEAAHALGLSPVAARSRLLRARTRARTSLAHHRPVTAAKETS